MSVLSVFQSIRPGGAALSDAGALAKSSAEGTSLRGVLRRGLEAPAFRIPGRTSGDKADVVRHFCRIPPERKGRLRIWRKRRTAAILPDGPGSATRQEESASRTRPGRGLFHGYASDDTSGSVQMQSFRGRNFPKRLPSDRALARPRRMAEGKASEQGTAEGEGAESPPWGCMLRLWRNDGSVKMARGWQGGELIPGSSVTSALISLLAEGKSSR